tara:strand:+ start:3738 stop:4346 length:609 start_codon:yes stop_codon:yes gene_type:complete
MIEEFRVRTNLPKRSDVAPRNSYREYRAELRHDFFGSCGYCGDDDERVDRITFHIDHFAPKSVFPDLALSYGNLVYACRFCNVGKSNHWIGSDPATANDGVRGFVDPCTEEYENHLERLPSGQIVGKSELGKYFAKRLKLHLLRHELLWQARRARRLREQVEELLQELERRGYDDSSEHHKLLKRYRELNKAIENYELGAHN